MARSRTPAGFGGGGREQALDLVAREHHGEPHAFTWGVEQLGGVPCKLRCRAQITEEATDRGQVARLGARADFASGQRGEEVRDVLDRHRGEIVSRALHVGHELAQVVGVRLQGVFAETALDLEMIEVIIQPK
jgi:hypothetical protein